MSRDDLFDCPYTYVEPVEIRWLPPGLAIWELMGLTEKGEHWGYNPKTGELRIAHPVELPE